MPTLNIIGLVGYKQSGKDTVCDYLREYLGTVTRVHRLAFADALKDEVCKQLSCDRKFLENNKSEFRSYLQMYGSQQKEKRGENVWITIVAKSINEINKNTNCIPHLFIIPDVRFPFEANWVREMGGVIIKIDRFDGTDDTHESEKEINNIRNPDWRLWNRGTLRDLKRESYWISGFIRERFKL